MKTITLIIIIISTSITVYSQNQYKKTIRINRKRYRISYSQTDSITTKDPTYEKTSKREIDKASIYPKNNVIYINPYLGSHLDKGETLGIILNNREYVYFIEHSMYVSALTIPFKYHGANHLNNVDIYSTFQASVDINTFIGYRISRRNFSYYKYEGMVEKSYSLTFGPFIGLSSLVLDEQNTSAHEFQVPEDTKLNSATINLGVGIVGHLNQFEFGLFIGTSKAPDDLSKRWNYINQPWLGIGLGYKLFILNPKSK